MPYIDKSKRKSYKDIETIEPMSVGDLNYCITNLCLNFMKVATIDTGEVNYKTVNDIIGALECAKQEFYRRVAVDYEKAKAKENGDVY